MRPTSLDFARPSNQKQITRFLKVAVQLNQPKGLFLKSVHLPHATLLPEITTTFHTALKNILSNAQKFTTYIWLLQGPSYSLHCKVHCRSLQPDSLCLLGICLPLRQELAVWPVATRINFMRTHTVLKFEHHPSSAWPPLLYGDSARKKKSTSKWAKHSPLKKFYLLILFLLKLHQQFSML